MLKMIVVRVRVVVMIMKLMVVCSSLCYGLIYFLVKGVS